MISPVTNFTLKDIRTVEIEINSYCNRKCQYCPNYTMKRIEEGNMPFDIFHKIIEELSKFHYDGKLHYHFFGEPLLNRDLKEYIRITRKQLPTCHPYIFTNGDLLTIDMLNALISIGIEHFFVTQQSDPPYTFKSIFMTIPASIQKMITYTIPSPK